ncbi:hypothetical protein ANN_05525 [Periplaneta americana]|uniref:Uncharacterized protein n=1 Tax=Periplaneta americana TaxID=6978 RepID=A0ABQ8TD72_PERAM|nr:hypothetical protein ANN_05525 [Periplaneta americana]
MAGLYDGGNESAGPLKAISSRSSTRVCVRICVSIRRPEFECSGPQLEGPEFECSGPQLEGPEFEYSELSLKVCGSRYRELDPSPNPQAGEPLLIGCPRLLIQYIRSYPPYLEAVSSIRNLKTRHAVVIGTHNTLGINLGLRCWLILEQIDLVMFNLKVLQSDIAQSTISSHEA